jgi:hypothetical protein
MQTHRQLLIAILLGHMTLWTTACAESSRPGLQPSKDATVDGTVDGASDPDAAVSPDSEIPPDTAVYLDANVDAAASCETSEHIFTETAETFVVPQDVRYMIIKAWGAGANEEEQCPGYTGKGGPGGYTAVVLDVSPGATLVTAGATLSVVVGRRVGQNETPDEIARRGFAASGGGGLSGVFTGGFPLSASGYDRAVVIAGGGGSAGSQNPSTCTMGLPGNHPQAGGMNDMQGGAGEHDNLNGGGGGYRGGQGGEWGQPGTGGTEHVPNHSDLLDSRIAYQNVGQWTPPMTSDLDYDGTAASSQARGLVVIRFVCDPPNPL